MRVGAIYTLNKLLTTEVPVFKDHDPPFDHFWRF
jgi:hypothetical protein